MYMSEVVITKRDNGPLVVKGPVILEDAEGNRYETKEQFSLCRCGFSEHKPFCDGSHRTKEFHEASRAPGGAE
jgi:CDGSH-type Zn-finger protein